MPVDPRPLEAGFQLADRFEIREVLGRGGFGIAYMASDVLKGDLVVIKELAPQGTPRSSENVLQFHEQMAPRLREHFLEEAGVLSHLNIRGIPPIRAIFRENGTAYFATDYIPHASTLQQFIDHNGPLSCSQALAIFQALLDILDAVHKKQILHRDIKPSNILLDDRGQVYLIDFGAAREWHTDSTTGHTVFYTPGYAPPEQLSERAKRGPATDIYAVCATMFVMLLGEPPPSVQDRVSGIPLPSLYSYRPDLDHLLAKSIESGLSLSYADRPQNITELRAMIERTECDDSAPSLAKLDQTLLRLQQFRYDRRSCPACNHLLSEVKPIKRNRCPVCRVGSIRKRDIQERLCPFCRSGVLMRVRNTSPLVVCPSCRRGALHYRRKNLLTLEQYATCNSCDARFDVKAGRMSSMLENDSEAFEFEVWRKRSGRSSEVLLCPDCPAQFDVLPDGQWTQVIAGIGGKYHTLYPDEWARIAIGLEPGAGNAECEACGADFHVEDRGLTLLGAHEDPNGFVASYLGRLIGIEDVRWLAVGKTSPNPGYVCEGCGTEFDRDQEYLRLIWTSEKRLARFIDRPRKLDDWHRIAQELPTMDQEGEFMNAIAGALRASYRDASFSFDPDGNQLWKSEAMPVGGGSSVTLSITRQEIVYGGLLRKKRLPLDAIVGVWADEAEIQFQFSGERDPVGFVLTPVGLTAKLASGNQTIQLDARDLAVRLTTQLAL